MRALLAVLLAAAPAAAQQAYLPVRGLPPPDPALASGSSRLALRGGAALLGGESAAMSGFSGGWGVEGALSDAWSVGAGSGGFGFGGRVALPLRGEVSATAVGVDPGAFVARRFSAGATRLALRAGVSVPFQSLSYSVAAVSVLPSGRVSLTPDRTYTLCLAVPVGAAVSRDLGGWALAADAGLSQVFAGARWDAFSFVGPLTPSRKGRVPPYPAFTARAEARHARTGLSLSLEWASRPRVDGLGPLWSGALLVGWDYGLKKG